jgi:hypothetical protein
MRENPITVPPRVRCAIYTRKSSEEGLEQSFNSLDAQREACEAYILSQRHEGWQLISARYDDGGFSGGTMEGPALKRLLEDLASKHIDTVVVYKVSRLTRSLADFAKIVEQRGLILKAEEHNASLPLVDRRVLHKQETQSRRTLARDSSPCVV